MGVRAAALMAPMFGTIHAATTLRYGSSVLGLRPVNTDSYNNLAFYANPGVYVPAYSVGAIANTPNVQVAPLYSDDGWSLVNDAGYRVQLRHGGGVLPALLAACSDALVVPDIPVPPGQSVVLAVSDPLRLRISCLRLMICAPMRRLSTMVCSVHHPMGRSEIAELLGMTRQGVDKCVGRDSTFPAAVALLVGGRIWETEAVERRARATGRLP